jgi:hypothetical protein
MWIGELPLQAGSSQLWRSHLTVVAIACEAKEHA